MFKHISKHNEEDINAHNNWKLNSNITCNIHDYLVWAYDVGIISKRKYEFLLKNADSFIAYVSYIDAFQIPDTKKYRKKWIATNKGKIISVSMTHSGFS